jgi:hypothetical protein
MRITFLFKSLKERDHSEDLDMDGSTILVATKIIGWRV